MIVFIPPDESDPVWTCPDCRHGHRDVPIGRTEPFRCVECEAKAFARGLCASFRAALKEGR